MNTGTQGYKRHSDRWIIIVGNGEFGTDNPDKRLTRYKEKATKFPTFDEALWRSEVIMYEYPDKDVRVVKWRAKKRPASLN